VASALNELAPPDLAQAWDNVGLLAGDRGGPCGKVLLCIDLTRAVLDEGSEAGCAMVVAYHPPIFRPVARLLADSDGTDAIVHDAIRRGVAVYSPHTALDAAPGGTNDVLAGLCGLSRIEPFEFVTPDPAPFKVVTFVPPDRLDAVARAMFAAGAGRIGDYEQCSYRLQGEGTFFGAESTDPQVGEKGRLERVRETRIEMIVPAAKLPEVIAALRAAHPYEEPAFDVYPLHPEPRPGIGRVGTLPKGTTLNRLARELKRVTGSKVVMTVGAGGRRLARAAVCVGAAGGLPLEKPRSADCDVIVTGEIRHHDALTLQRIGKCAIALGHSESERPVLKPLARRLSEATGVQTLISRRDTPPFAPV
jgi:dinuclear metal center YbgI/SA1388 family protein